MTGGVLVVPSIVLAAGATAPTAPASALTLTGTHMVPAVLSGLSLATPNGPAPANQVVSIGVSLQRPNTSGESQLYSGLYDPSSPEYQQFLTPAQFDQEFGVPAAQSSAVENWLQAGGLQVGTTSAAGDYFTAHGTVAQLDSLFHVAIGDYTFDGQRFYANNVPPSVPNALPIDAVTGLDDVRQFTLAPLSGSVTQGTSSPVTGVAPLSGVAQGPQPGDEGVLTPQDVWGIYDDPGAAALTNANGSSTPATLAASHTTLGQGQTIGVFGEGETSSVVAQLRLFEQAMGFPKIPVRTVETEGAPNSAYGDNAGSVEWDLDTQASTGMAPDASQLDFYFAKSLFDTDVFADFDTWANDPNGPRQMNASFGECEQDPTNPITGPLAQLPYGTEFGDELEAVGEPILRQATLEGRTLFTSSGDTGSGCPELVAPVIGAGNGLAVQPVPEVSYPCTSQYVVCVGGTVVSTNGTSYPQAAQRAAETSWTFGGGGTSYFVPEPSFQVGVANVDHQCLSTPSGDPYSPADAPLCRGVPDVADMSGTTTGNANPSPLSANAYFIYIDGNPASEGGTSLSSPMMMGQWARIQAAAPARVQKTGGLGFADETIYRQAKSADSCGSANTATCSSSPYARDFFDVTESEYGLGNGTFQPGPGWDYTSGWGALDVANFVRDVDGSTNAAQPYAGAEKPAVTVAQAAMNGPLGDATDPVVATLGNDPSLNITGATLTASASKGIVATLSGPDLGALPPPDGGGGATFYVAWLSTAGGQDIVWFAQAIESPTGAWTFSSGNTGVPGSGNNGYIVNSSSQATGSVNTDTGTITIDVPASEVGSPAPGSLLLDPQAFDQLNVGTPLVWLALTTDSADSLTPVSQDGGLSVSRGLQVAVGS
jgi:subtilase family serine protease